ncbi:MAG: response regulator, partial [Bradyrhizobium sp.]|nr:response regulator [Bradyrhizobium sp.]
MKTCLVVDDSGVVRKIARRILEEMGFNIIEAEDGAKALEACKTAMPEAVLLDWNMPVMDGYEFLGHLRRMPGGDAPKVV